MHRNYEGRPGLFLNDGDTAVAHMLTAHLAHIPRALGGIQIKVHSDALTRPLGPPSLEFGDFVLRPGMEAL